jgi:hypothetical protein
MSEIEVRRRPIRAIQYDGRNAAEVILFAEGRVKERAGMLRGTPPTLHFANGPQIITGEWIVWEPRDGFGLYADAAFRRIYEPAIPARTEPGDPTHG